MVRKLTRRGILHVGYRCNLDCAFCFYKYKKRKIFRPLSALKTELFRIKEVYRNKFVDIYGGEPTIYPRILEIVEFCRNIGLNVTIATNAQRLDSRQFCRDLKDAGVNDFLISIHGPRKVHNLISNNKNAFSRFSQAVNNLKHLNIPFRTNTVITRLNYEDLVNLATILNAIKPQVCNFIMFNPFNLWRGSKIKNIVIKNSTASAYLKKAIDKLSKAGIKINIRYFPFCLLKGYEKYVCNFPQVSFDEHEYDFASWFDRRNIKTPRDYLNFAVKIHNIFYTKTKMCNKCSVQLICGGVKKKLLKLNRGDEKPYYNNSVTRDPLFFKQGNQFLST